MNNDLISRSALLKLAVKPFPDALSSMVSAWDIAHAPAVDAVAVVRCKDCKHWEADRNGQTGECFHELWEDAEGWSKTTEPTEFCSRGERRSDD